VCGGIAQRGGTHTRADQHTPGLRRLIGSRAQALAAATLERRAQPADAPLKLDRMRKEKQPAATPPDKTRAKAGGGAKQTAASRPTSAAAPPVTTVAARKSAEPARADPPAPATASVKPLAELLAKLPPELDEKMEQRVMKLLSSKMRLALKVLLIQDYGGQAR
jgi:hypothetical protein